MNDGWTPTNVGVLIGVLMTGIVTVVNAWANVNYRRSATADRQKVAVRTEEIHDLVNGSSEKAAARLSALEAQILSLNQEIRRLQDAQIQRLITHQDHP